FHFPVLYRHQSGRFPSAKEVFRLTISFMAGMITLTIALGLINVSIGRDFLFFRILLDIVASRVSESSGNAALWLPWSAWWFLDPGLSYQYLYFGFAVFVTCIAVVVFAVLMKGRIRANSIALSVQVQYLLLVGLWVFWQSVGQVALQPDYFAYP